jgi:hypothetical protein
MKKSAFILLTLVLTGCAGVFVSTSVDRDIKNPQLENEGKHLSYSDGADTMDKTELLKRWGKPLVIRTLDNGSETWEYELEQKIERDVELMIGLFPITIDLPDETQTVIFTVSDGLVIKAKTKIAKTNGAVCGLVPTQHFGVKLGCTQ